MAFPSFRKNSISDYICSYTESTMFRSVDIAGVYGQPFLLVID